MTFAEILNRRRHQSAAKKGLISKDPLDGRIVLVLCRVGRERLTVNLISLRVAFLPTNGATTD